MNPKFFFLHTHRIFRNAEPEVHVTVIDAPENPAAPTGAAEQIQQVSQVVEAVAELTGADKQQEIVALLSECRDDIRSVRALVESQGAAFDGLRTEVAAMGVLLAAETQALEETAEEIVQQVEETTDEIKVEEIPVAPPAEPEQNSAPAKRKRFFL